MTILKNKKYNFKSAFTLAEVLITLVVVGVIAALTIPTVIYKTKKTEYSVRLKKFYSTMNQVIKLSQAKGKNWEDWASVSHSGYDVDTVDSFLNEYALPYLSYVKKEIKDRRNEQFVFVYLNDGSIFYAKKGECIDFEFDVNGNKKPNTFGKDMFVFMYCAKGSGGWSIRSKFIPYQQSEYSRNTALALCKTNAFYCSALLAIDGWEFKDDYPYSI